MGLPRPDVAVQQKQSDTGIETSITVSRDGKARSYAGTGTAEGGTQEAVRKMLDDPRTAEWLPGPGEKR